MSTTLEKAVKVDSNLIRALSRTIRGLSIDAIEKANSGHPGLPLGFAEAAVTIWYYFLRFDPEDPKWVNRDKFILSAGHGSMLLYSLLHLAGYDLSMEEIQNFRQFGSKTPGHPEANHTPGVECTTGPLGQGFGNAVGFALADKMLSDRVNTNEHVLIDSFVYCVAGDGDLMEGVCQEAASFAGQMGLGNLIVFYDDNDVSLDGPTSLTFDHEDKGKRFEAYNWQVLRVDGYDHQALADAIVQGRLDPTRPTLIVTKTVIGYGSPNMAGLSDVHGSPLGPDEARLTKERLGIPLEPEFHIPDADKKAWAERREQVQEIRRDWERRLEKTKGDNPSQVETLHKFFSQDIPEDIEKKLPKFDPNKAVATRSAGKTVMTALGEEVPWLVGGSADLSGSTKAIVGDAKTVSQTDYTGRHIYFGVREHAMGAVCNGMTLQGAFRAYGGTFLTFHDYMRPSVRLSALTPAPSIWVYTHDSIFLGEDGPTHQPVEHYAALRTIPNLISIRPADAYEVSYAWITIMREKHQPCAILLTRQNVPVFDRDSDEFNSNVDVEKGAYVLRPEKGDKVDLILIGTGSEVRLCVEAARTLEEEGLGVRVVSMPSWELFRRQAGTYQQDILPPKVKARVAVESGIPMGWDEWTGEKGRMIGVTTYGASAPWQKIAEEYGFTPENVIKVSREVLASLKEE